MCPIRPLAFLLLLGLQPPVALSAQSVDSASAFIAQSVEDFSPALLAQQIDSLRRLDPEHEAAAALNRGDRRYLATEARGVVGIPDSAAAQAFAARNFRYIPRTGDYVVGPEHERWQSAAVRFAIRYNRALWGHPAQRPARAP